VDVPLTAPRTAGAGDRSNASSENPAARNWCSVQPQKPNISAQSAQNMSAQWQQCQRQHNDISEWVAVRDLMMHSAPPRCSRLFNDEAPLKLQNQASSVKSGSSRA